MGNHEDLKLVERVLAKERQAFDEFFETYFARLCRFCSTRVDDSGAVEDVVQETLFKALRSMHSYRGEALLFTWLCQICRHEISNWYQRHGRKQPRLVSLYDNPEIQAALESLSLNNQQEQLHQTDLAGLVQLTLDYLPERYSRVLEWKYVEGLSVKEIARRMGTGRLAVQSLLSRARRAFRQSFTDVQKELTEI